VETQELQNRIENEPPEFFFEKFVRYKLRGFATENYVFYKIQLN